MVVCYSSNQKKIQGQRWKQAPTRMPADKDERMVKVRQRWAGKGEGPVWGLSLSCPVLPPPLWSSFVNYPHHPRPLPKAGGRLLLRANHLPLVSVLEIQHLPSFRAEELMISPRLQGFLPISWATLKGSTVFLLQSVFLVLALNDLADGTALSSFPGSLGSLHPLALPGIFPAGAFQKHLFKQAATSLPWTLASWLHSGFLPRPTAVTTSWAASLQCETCFWLEKLCPWVLHVSHSFAVDVPWLGR